MWRFATLDDEYGYAQENTFGRRKAGPMKREVGEFFL